MRALRRAVVKHFGSTRNFLIWVVAVSLSIYFIDSFVLTRDRLQVLLNGNKDDVKQMKAALEVPGVIVAKEEPKVDKPADVSKRDPEPPVPAKGPKCGMQEECPPDKVAFRVESGYGRETSPTICFNGNDIVSKAKNNGHRGLNVVTINEKTLQVEDFRYFDTYVEEDALVRYFNLGLTESKIVLIASQDEASSSLKESAKSWLYQYGSTQIEKLGFRDAFVMAGQRGLTRGSAIEKLVPRNEGKEFAEVASVSGCLSSPMGKLGAVVAVKAPVKPPAPGEELPNCGVTENCGEQGFPVHVYSGKGNAELLKICVGGKYVMAKGINDAGRGFNVVVIDSKTKEVIRVGHFDTYAEDSSNLEIFLELLNDKDIVVAVTFDEASKSLNSHAHKLFESLGSAFVSKLSFRDMWSFVGQKGINGYSPFEELEFAGPPGSWPKSIDKHYCVPTAITGSKTIPDKLPLRNERRRTFCAKFDGYGEFCTSEHIDQPLSPTPLVDKNMENEAVFSVPIVIIPGLNHNAFRLQLEALLHNPGLKPDMVHVMYDEKFEEPAELAAVFGFSRTKLDGSTKYIFQMHKAIDKIWQVFPKATSVIVLEEEVIPSPDLLCFFSRCLAVPEDSTLAGCSAWNPNGYKETSGAPELLYRVKIMPGYGFLIKKSFYEQQLKDNWVKCCSSRSWDNWVVGDYEMVVPDVSRVYRRPYEGLSDHANYLTELFTRERTTSTVDKCAAMETKSLADGYEQLLGDLVMTSTALDVANAGDCLTGKGLGFYVPASKGKLYAIYYEQKSPDDYSVLSKLCKCFKLFYQPDHAPIGLHKGIIRFFYNENQIMFVGSQSAYYVKKPANAGVVADKPVAG